MTPVFPSDAAAESERAAILAELPAFSACRGHLGDGARKLLAALDRRSELLERARRVHRYAFLKVSEDARVESSQALMTSANDMVSQLRAASAFFDPEIIAIGASRVAAFEAAEPGLAPYHHGLVLLLRRAGHVLGPEAEAAIAASNALRNAPSDIHELFTNAEMPWPTIEVHGKGSRLNVPSGQR